MTTGHVRLTSHSGGTDAPALHWGAPTAPARGPIVGTTARAHRNVIGTHSGAYGVYRALAVAAEVHDAFRVGWRPVAKGVVPRPAAAGGRA